MYTPTVGRAVQEFSHIIRRTRGTSITPADVDRVPEILRQGPFEDVRLVVVTDNERILGLGDQGAGGMAIPIGKLALYTAACGIYPSLTLPVSLDVGTDNPALLADPLYLGHRAPRLRGLDYDDFVEAFVNGVETVWPGCLIQFEDFKQANALRILDRYQGRVPSFNDDIQGTAAVVLAGVLAGLRATGRTLADARIVLVGAGAAGIGIARLLRLAMRADGLSEARVAGAIALVDTKGLVHAGRVDLDPSKAALVVPSELDAGGDAPDLVETIRERRPTILVGTTGVAGTFNRAVVGAMADALEPAEPPIILPLSNPTSFAEATPADVLAWTDGRAARRDGSRSMRSRWTAGATRSAKPTMSSSSRASGSARSSRRPRSSRTPCSCGPRPSSPPRSATSGSRPAPSSRRSPRFGRVARDRDRRGPRCRLCQGRVRGGLRDVVAGLRPLPADPVAGSPTGPRAVTTPVRAALLEATGERVVIAELDLIEPRAGEVRVRMFASGVCHSDLHIRDGEWKRPTPIVMGHEGAGVVEAMVPA